MHPTLLLVSSPGPDWDVLRAGAQVSPAVRLLACCASARVALSLATRHRPDVVLADADMPGRSVVPFVGDLRAASPASKVVLIGERAALDQGTLAALWHRGVAAYFVWEDVRPETVLDALLPLLSVDVLICSRVVSDVMLTPEGHRHPRAEGLMLSASEREALRQDITVDRHVGQHAVTPEVATAAVALLRAARAETGELSPNSAVPSQRGPEQPSAAAEVALSERERAVCALAAEGKHYPAIAAQLCITTSTVKTHAAHAKTKLGMGEREELGPAYRRLMRG